jgi:hypothetical protein
MRSRNLLVTTFLLWLCLYSLCWLHLEHIRYHFLKREWDVRDRLRVRHFFPSVIASSPAELLAEGRKKDDFARFRSLARASVNPYRPVSVKVPWRYAILEDWGSGEDIRLH